MQVQPEALPEQQDTPGSAAPWAQLGHPARAAWAAQAVAAAVGKILGRQLAGHEPFMSAGLDSLGVLTFTAATGR